MADAEDIQPLVCDNGTGMVKVSQSILYFLHWPRFVIIIFKYLGNLLMHAWFTGWICW